MNSKEFFNFNPHQSVNSVLVGILLVSWCVWMVVYYFNSGTESIVKLHEQGAEELVTLLEGN